MSLGEFSYGRVVMKNNQVIDGVQNCRYPIYVAIKEKVRLLLPADGQDAEFIEDALARRGKKKLGDALARIWQSEVKKPDVVGIHGTFFYELD
jgi:hypothetical protein